MRTPRKNKLDELNILKPYNQVDAELIIIINYVVSQFMKLKAKLTKEDKTHVVVYEMFDDIYILMLDCYAEIYRFYANEYRGAKEAVMKFLETSNPITKYIFKEEFDRKRAYLLEALTVKDADVQLEATRSAIRLNRIIKEFAVQIADMATLKKYKKDGVKKVKWQVLDTKACDKCKALDGKVFKIEELPIKPHINCRCWIIPYGQSKQAD